MIRVLLDEDGLLQRFGRPDPDAVGLVEVLGRLQAGLARRPRPRAASETERTRQRVLSIEVAAVRFFAGGTTSDGESVTGLPLHVLDEDSDLAAGDLYFTTSHTRLVAALRRDVTAYVVGLEPVASERSVDFSTVPRLVEEALRLPTARPRSQATRRGGLLAISVTSKVQARSEALEAIRVDPNADWVQLGDHLLLYTEDPDLEDRLAVRPDVEHLSYGVSRDDLVVERSSTGPATDDEATATADDAAAQRRISRSPTSADAAGVLFRHDDVVVREMTTPASRSPRDAAGSPDGGGAGEPRRSWHEVRRRYVDITDVGAEDDGERISTALSRDERATVQARVGELEDALRPRLRTPTGEALLGAIQGLTRPAASADAWPGDAPAWPRYVAWQSPYTDAAADDLLILLHRLPPLPDTQLDGNPPADSGHRAFVRSVATALATSELLRDRPSAVGTLHVLDAPSTPSGVTDDAPAPASLFMLANEHNRVRAVLSFPAGVDASTRAETLVSRLAALAGDRNDDV